VLELQDGDSNKWQVGQLFTWTYTNQATSWLVRNWSIFGARTSHEQTQTHKTHHSPNSGEITTFPPYSILYAWSRGQHPNVIFSQDSQVGIPKFPKLRLPQLWRPIILCVDLRLRWGLRQNINPHWELSNDMW
jgi:hypothetical protein